MQKGRHATTSYGLEMENIDQLWPHANLGFDDRQYCRTPNINRPTKLYKHTTSFRIHWIVSLKSF